MLVRYKSLIDSIKPGKWALPTFNTFDLEMTQGILQAAELEKSPIAIEISQSSLEHGWDIALVKLVANLADQVSVPVAVHYDHGQDYKAVKAALKLPFSSVMIAYAPNKSLEENISSAKKIVKLARLKKVAVQGEVGHVTGPKDYWRLPDKWLTDPEDALRFVGETGVDALSVSIGNRHGIASGSVQIDLERLKSINKLVKIPLVLHGGSGLRKKNYLKAIKNGIEVVNFDTDLRYAFSTALSSALETQVQRIAPRKALHKAAQAAQNIAIKKIRILGASGRAR